VHEDYFSKFGYEPNIDSIDFVITDKKAMNYLVMIIDYYSW
jgi:hypothetical protein